MSPCKPRLKLCFVLAYSIHTESLYVIIKMLHNRVFFFFRVKKHFNYIIIRNIPNILLIETKNNRHIIWVHKAAGNFEVDISIT